MTALLAVYGAMFLPTGLVFGASDVALTGLIALGIAAVLWLVKTSYAAWLRNANASELLRATDERRRVGGAL